MRLNRLEEAGHWYRKSLRTKPDHIPAHLTYGKLLSITVSPKLHTHTHRKNNHEASQNVVWLLHFTTWQCLIKWDLKSGDEQCIFSDLWDAGATILSISLLQRLKNCDKCNEV